MNHIKIKIRENNIDRLIADCLINNLTKDECAIFIKPLYEKMRTKGKTWRRVQYRIQRIYSNVRIYPELLCILEKGYWFHPVKGYKKVKVSNKDLYDIYLKYCEKHNITPCNRWQFGVRTYKTLEKGFSKEVRINYLYCKQTC